MGWIAALAVLLAWPGAAQPPAPVPIAIDEPAGGAVFPPGIVPPVFVWRDPSNASGWNVEIRFSDGSPLLHFAAKGERLTPGEIDLRCVSSNNQLPTLTPQEAAARTWTPDASAWHAIQSHSIEHPATVILTGLAAAAGPPVSRGQVAIVTSRDPVGAPIFYRDVPLMPTGTEKGLIKPLPPEAISSIAWRVLRLDRPGSRLVLQGMPTCANCHSFSLDGKTLGMDVDGPENDKGTYAIAPLRPRMSIETRDVITWNSFPGRGSRPTIGFLSQISPDGQFAVSTLDEDLYVANFKDYRFLQVFYPTRGILAWYSCATGAMKALPGADDPRFVQTDSVWTPDGKSIVFARAPAKDPYVSGQPLADYAGDPVETPIQYDLYRVPFNAGRGGRPEPIRGASRNGMSNSFPKVSPDGRWIVFVQSRNGQLMRPDSRLYIVPAAGGEARLMRCNTPRMNSWHSFSPNGRWMVFSSKSHSPYTEMFLTHIDRDGNDSPAIRIRNATAANRAVNIPEFVNIPADGLEQIDVPAAEFYRIFDLALGLAGQGRFDAAIAEWNKALAIDPESFKAENNLGIALLRAGRVPESLAHFQKAVALQPVYPPAHFNFGNALSVSGQPDRALAEWQKAVELYPDFADARAALGLALAARGRTDQAIVQWQRAVQIEPKLGPVQNNLGVALSSKGQFAEAVAHFRQALAVQPGDADIWNNLGAALTRLGNFEEAIAAFRKSLDRRPLSAETEYNLGAALAGSHNLPEALAAWREGLKSAPDSLPLLRQTAWTLATSPDDSLRNGAQAVDLARHAISVAKVSAPELLDVLAAALAETGRFPDAESTASQAAALAARQSQPALAAAIATRAALYRSGRPFRDSH